MAKVKIITHPAHLGANADDSIIETGLRLIAVAFGDPEEWTDKYGTDFENDVFMMHRYCWCERSDCPWCAGCAAFEDVCVACRERKPHSPNCYQTVLGERRKAAGFSHWHNGEYVEDAPKWKNVSYDIRSKAEEKIYRALTRERNLPYEGCSIHCDCGADEAHRKDVPLRGCDYARGTGIFTRFAPYQHGVNGYCDPPNFWFKPSDFRLQWYKYIGRDMRANKTKLPGDWLHQIFATHPQNMTVENALNELQRRTDESHEAFRRVIEAVNSGTSR